MTTKQIAETTGKDETTVRRWVRKVAGKMTAIAGKMTASNSTTPADYSLDETLAIIESGMGKNAAMIWAENAKRVPVSVKSESRLDRLEKMIEAQAVGMGKLLEALSVLIPAITPRTALPMLDYYSVLGYAIKVNDPIKNSDGGLKSLSYKCKTLSLERGVSIVKIPDPRFGEVNTYRVDILEEIFSKGH